MTEGKILADTDSFLLYSASHSSCRIEEHREKEDKLKECSRAVAEFYLSRAQHWKVGILSVFLTKLRPRNSSYLQFSLRETCKSSQLHTNMLKACS